MNEIAQLFLSNYTTFCLVIGLVIITVTNRSLDERTNRSFILFSLLVLALLIADATDYYMAGFSEPTNLRYLSSAAGYTLRSASLALLIGILLRRKRTSILLWVPIIFVGLVAFTSQYTHFMFWFGTHNQFIRGPLCYIAHVVSAVYLVLLVVLTAKMHRRLPASELFAVLYSAAICVVATTFESVLSGYKFLLTGAMATSCALYYVVLYVETYRCDPLTGLMNRRSFYLDAKRMHNKPMAVISIDLNGLKDINDTLGHSAGDMALLCLGNATFAKSRKEFTAYRVGGDEFMALGKEQSEESVRVYVDGMRAALKADSLMASFGYAFYTAGDDFDVVCNQADARMYEDKKRYKHRAGGRGGDAPVPDTAQETSAAQEVK